jgi:hypothetical protein
MEATCSSETSVDFQRTTQCYIPEDRILHNHRRENLKSYKPHTVLKRKLCILDSSYVTAFYFTKDFLSFAGRQINVTFICTLTYAMKAASVTLKYSGIKNKMTGDVKRA